MGEHKELYLVHALLRQHRSSHHIILPPTLTCWGFDTQVYCLLGCWSPDIDSSTKAYNTHHARQAKYNTCGPHPIPRWGWHTGKQTRRSTRLSAVDLVTDHILSDITLLISLLDLPTLTTYILSTTKLLFSILDVAKIVLTPSPSNYLQTNTTHPCTRYSVLWGTVSLVL